MSLMFISDWYTGYMKPRWNPEIRNGDLLNGFIMVCTAIVFVVWMKRDIDIGRFERDNMKDRITFIENATQKLAESQVNQMRTTDRITILLEQHLNNKRP